jgi:1-acyl-sn-glycerol-3-phosphate acyltransferase
MSATRLTRDGVSRLPDRPKILVANHSSYLDGLVLLASIPGDYSFVAKKELADSIWTGPFLAHLGTKFVERFDAKQGAADAEILSEAVSQGTSLVFFPEGTFRRMPGLLPFRTGAFACAAQGNVPVVPIALCGTRYILRSESWFPRFGQVSVKIADPIMPAGIDWAAVLALRDRAREQILELSGEPDLVYETGVMNAVKEEAEA